MVKIGVIGCGKIAQTRHLPEYATNPHAKLVGYYDKIRERSVQMAELYGGKVYETYYDMINDPEIDAVSICVENRNHAEITNAALYAGKHVLVEKPMAVTLAECESMVAAAEFNGKHGPRSCCRQVSSATSSPSAPPSATPGPRAGPRTATPGSSIRTRRPWAPSATWASTSWI